MSQNRQFKFIDHLNPILIGFIFLAINLLHSTHSFAQNNRIESSFSVKKDARLAAIVAPYIDEMSELTGPIVADIDTNQIFYVEIKPLKSIKQTKKQPKAFLNPFDGIPTYTLFQLLVKDTHEKFTKFTLDTLDFNSGCCPCHFPLAVEDAYFDDSQQKSRFIIKAVHPVRDDCNSVTYRFSLVYNNLLEDIFSGNYHLHHDAMIP